MKKLLLIFVLAFFANFIWEHFHAPLYVHYQGGDISEFILLRAALFDAAAITILGIAFMRAPFLRKRLWLAFVFGVFFAVGLEWWALTTERWAYGETMPVIPLIGTGLTPTIQLGFLAYVIFIIAKGLRD